MATTTMNLSSVLTDAEESINKGVKEAERTFFFTDVPCGAMKFRPEDFKGKPSEAGDDDVTSNLLAFCGGIERAFCFSDLEDVDESDAERLKSKSIMENEAPAPVPAPPQKEEQPVVETADTESMSDDSAPKETADATAAEATPTVTPVKEEETKPEDAAKASTPAERVAETVMAAAESIKDKVEEAKVTQSVTSLPPANALQASLNKTKDGKPMNALQAAKAAKAAQKKDGKKKKGWGLFRRSSRKATA